ncbi:MAG: UDP-N-acetylmuramate:L-alanyl-gamma-D-glutamyl-meso-diaminopimelate ligase [SAR86 cluster bacterium]|uniref:UDP-N-acetylmuramate--L-alanyl-gamma-D-glutamyl-meso-2,6-diaminoheptandioate ligase n=1 Tax=SAR86 cluster bacterium TaxID=2030880 RepID=A0A2A4MQS0_9GAMM|nr:MAG: UDP-N-acetylmuramate:L-alanyl-gamma-D-glutamyl-meso-diaminopimelate ligase [SAR86 cluster bacterium]
MHIHILGICGTFMGSLAVLAKQLGHRVSGSDANVYPPMSTQLQQQGITLMEGYKVEHLQPHPDVVVIGNALSRGNAAVEYVLEQGLDYYSGPGWLSRWVLKDRWVLGVAGTHGKTTTSSMLAWILEYAGLKPGYLIGGVAKNFPSSASLGESPFFVIEADEYDSAFFDKRSKFVHYAPRTTILNNLEFDHADIFDDLAAIGKQFHHLIRTIPGEGLILSSFNDANLDDVLAQGCWSKTQQFGLGVAMDECERVAVEHGIFWNANIITKDGSRFEIIKYSAEATSTPAVVDWDLNGVHNVSNALAAIAAAHHVGVSVEIGAAALEQFQGIKRRMELCGEVGGVSVYDDFAHHPTAIATTLQGLAAKLTLSDKATRLIAVIEPRSNTMQSAVHQQSLVQAIDSADLCLWYQVEASDLDLIKVVSESKVPGSIYSDLDELIHALVADSRPGDHIVTMSNGAFGGIHSKLIAALAASEKA